MKTCVFKPKDLLAIYPINFAYAYCQENVNRASGAQMHQIFIVNNGSGILNIAGEEITLTVGDMFFLKAGEPHFYGGNEDFQTTFLSFDGDMCKNIFKYFNVEKSGVYKSKNYRIPELLIQNFYRNFEDIDDFAMISSTTYNIIVSFFSEALKSEKTYIEKVKSYVETNFAKAISLSEITEFYPYSKAKLCRDFKKEYGVTVFEMLMRIRLEHAEILLKTSPLIKLKKIAQSCGFSDTSYFCKMYKKTFGKTPRE